MNGHECLCAPGYAGAACEEDVDDCAAAPCANGGACRDGVDSFACECTPGFMGQTCQVGRKVTLTRGVRAPSKHSTGSGPVLESC